MARRVLTCLVLAVGALIWVPTVWHLLTTWACCEGALWRLLECAYMCAFPIIVVHTMAGLTPAD